MEVWRGHGLKPYLYSCSCEWFSGFTPALLDVLTMITWLIGRQRLLCNMWGKGRKLPLATEFVA